MTPQAQSSAGSDLDKVRSLIFRAFDVLQSDDFDQYFELFTDDAVWMLPSSYWDVNLTEARNFYGFTKKFRFDQKTMINELVVADGWGFARVSFDGHLRPKGDDNAVALRSVSRHLWIFRKDEMDTWKIARDIWNNPKDI